MDDILLDLTVIGTDSGMRIDKHNELAEFDSRNRYNANCNGQQEMTYLL